MNIDKKYQLKMGENALNYLLLTVYEHYEADPEFRLNARLQLTTSDSQSTDDSDSDSINNETSDSSSNSVWKVVSNEIIEAENIDDTSFVLINQQQQMATSTSTALSSMEVQKAIDFSRTLYNLLPIDIFDIDQDDDGKYASF